MGAHTRKKQPDLVRRALLDNAAKIAVAHGMAGVTIQAVSEAAGVTKGGLFHHFPSKQSLVEGLFRDLLERIDAEIDAYIAGDPDDFGSFTRAYVKSVFVGREAGLGTPWAALSMTAIVDPALKKMWYEWMAGRLKRHRSTDSAPMLEVVRMAADGAWLSHDMALTNFQKLRKTLLAITKNPELA